MKRLVLWLPLALFAVVLVIAGIGLYAPSDPTIRSRLVGQPLPEFTLPAAIQGRPSVAGGATGQARMINIFASWCVPCIAEAPHLETLAQAGVPIEAIAIRDRPEDIARFLDRWGDPYRGIARDDDSSVQLALGSSGVPETFIVDAQGTIRHQHIGAINENDVADLLATWEAVR